MVSVERVLRAVFRPRQRPVVRNRFGLVLAPVGSSTNAELFYAGTIDLTRGYTVVEVVEARWGLHAWWTDKYKDKETTS